MDQITNNFKAVGFETRPSASNGVGSALLLPSIFVLTSVTHYVPPIYQAFTFASLGLLSYSIIFILYANTSCSILKKTTFSGATPLSIVFTILIYTFTELDLLKCAVVSFTNLHLYSHLLRYALKSFPKTFTVGEAMVVSQSVVLFITGAAMTRFIQRDEIDEEEYFFQSIIFTLLTTVAFIVTTLCYLNEIARNLKSLSLIIVVAATIEIFLLFLFIGPHAVPKMLDLLFSSSYRIKILILWLSLVLIAVVVLIIQTMMGIKASTSTRKTFHLLAASVFLTGVLGDVLLMSLAAGVGLGLLILVEGLRKSRIEPISLALESAFVTYSDEKDCGSFAMTPIYLFCGLACPLVLVPSYEHFTLELLSGVLSIGVGDTAASFFGSKFGRIKWPGSNKTVEGMVCNALSQLLLVITLQYFALLPAGPNILRTAIAAVITALVEINTDQVDNLILPLVAMATFRATSLVIKI